MCIVSLAHSLVDTVDTECTKKSAMAVKYLQSFLLIIQNQEYIHLLMQASPIGQLHDH